MITMFFIIACIITACSNDDNPNVEMTNGVTLSVVGNAFMAEDDTGHQYSCTDGICTQ